MRKQHVVLLQIKNNRKITRETDFEFLYHMQNALLLALREQGILSPMHHHHAEEKLRKQRRERARRKQEEP